MDDGRFVFLATGEDLPALCFQRVPEAKAVKNRMHLDLVGGGPRGGHGADRASSAARGRAERTRSRSSPWRTVADPEGNEFDITTAAERRR